MIRFLASLTLAICFSPVVDGGPLSTRVIEGADDGPTVRFIIGRAEREHTIGLDRQLAAMALRRGRMIVETHASDGPIVPGDIDGDAPVFDVMIHWQKDHPEAFEPATPQLPFIASTQPDRVGEWFRAAVGDSVDEEIQAALVAASVDGNDAAGADTAEIRFLTPRNRVTRGRQYRIGRRFAENVLNGFGMLAPSGGFWPSGMDLSKLICIYDAEGCGYIGSVRLERVVDRTTLGHQVTMVCGEDIREGALAGVAAVVFPGGTATGIAQALRPEGVEAVKSFVHQGGAFIGVCAGAYFATSGNELYSGMMHLEHHSPWLKGQAMLKMELTPEGVEILGEEFKTFTNRYNNGPVFPDFGNPEADAAHQPVTSLAVFKEATTRRGVHHSVKIDTPAIVIGGWGGGRIITISPHPETHEELDVLVARCYAWALEIPRDEVHLRQ